jgi:DNA-3-methyladenine glycosylase
MKIPREFYLREDVVQVSKELLGKYLYTCFDGLFTGGIITETEAYEGIIDRASHAFGGRRTNRTEIMYREGGKAYVYLCYGIHSLFNVVTHSEGTPHAVLIRAIYPVEGIEIMQKRRKSSKTGAALTTGPGTVSTALGLHYTHTGKDLLGNEIWLEDKGLKIPEKEIIKGPRVGVDYAGEHAAWPYRFRVLPAFIEGLLGKTQL